jgi:hypothetical protein
MKQISIKCQCGYKNYIAINDLGDKNYRDYNCKKCNAILKLPPKFSIKEKHWRCIDCEWDKILRIWEYEQNCEVCKYNHRKINNILDKFEPKVIQC